MFIPPGKKNRKLRFSSNIEIWNTWNIARTWKSAWNGLALSWRRPQSSRNQSIDLQNKPMDWFLYDRGLHHERVKSILIKGDIDLVSTQNISYPMISTRTCVNQWVRNTSFFGTFCVWTKKMIPKVIDRFYWTSFSSVSQSNHNMKLITHIQFFNLVCVEALGR